MAPWIDINDCIRQNPDRHILTKTVLQAPVVPMIQPVTRYTRLLLGANIVVAVFLLVGVTEVLLDRRQSSSSGDPVSAPIAQQAQSAARLLMSELERVRHDTRAAAEL